MTRGKKKVLIIGTGSIGKRHYRIFHDILSCDTYIKSSKVSREKDLELKGYKIFNKNINYDIGIIATTSDKHLQDINKFLELCNIWLIEKPIVSIYNFNPNISTSLKIKQKSFVGYNKRFEIGIMKLKDFLKNKNIKSAKFTCLSNLEVWRKQPLRESISLDRCRGGGVINELSHEIDLASFIIGQIKSINGEVYQKKFIDTDVEDSASLEIIHNSGIKSLIDISFASSFEKRIIEIKTDTEQISYDHHTGHITVKFNDLLNQKLIAKTKEERDKSFQRQAEALIYNNHKDLCTFQEGMDLIKKVYDLRWQ